MSEHIFINSRLPEMQEVTKIHEILNIEEDAVLGRLCQFWGWCSKHTNGGKIGISAKEVDSMMETEGWSNALIQVGWMQQDSAGELSIAPYDGLHFPCPTDTPEI